MDSGFSKQFLSNIGVKQRCPLLPTLFGLCIDKLDEVVKKVARKQVLNNPIFMQNFILFLLYANDVVLFSYDVDSMQHLLGVLEEFCHSSGLAVNVEKTKRMAMQTIQPHHWLTYRGEHIQNFQSFIYFCFCTIILWLRDDLNRKFIGSNTQ